MNEKGSMNRSEFVPITELIPHSGRMVLLDQIVSHDQDSTICSVTIGSNPLFQSANGDVPSWVGIEFMAQGAAVHAGLVFTERGDSIPMGFLVGSRKIEFSVSHFTQGQTLEVEAELVLDGDIFGVFACAIYDAENKELLVQGKLNIYKANEIEQDKEAIAL